jgi:vacuolar-type H+-ATPase subunit I/STV1
MNGGSRIINLRVGDAGDAALQDLLLDEPPAHDVTDVEAAEEARGSGWFVPALVIVLGTAWIAGALWLARGQFAVLADPLRAIEFVGAICVPLALLALLYLVALRTSRAEAARFGATAQAMRAEAASLERTVAVLADAIEKNRQQLADQTTQLLALGDGAVTRLGQVSSGMAEQVAAADRHATTLADAAEHARSSLEVVLASLPHAQADTAAMTERLERVGLAAAEHVAGLDANLAALAERGREADALASGAAQRLAAHIQRMEATGETAGTRLETVTAEMSEAVDGLLERTAGAVDEARKGITAQGDAMLAMVSAHQAALDTAARDNAEALGQRIAAIEAVIDRIAARLEDQRVMSDAVVTSVSEGVDAVEGRLARLHDQGIERTQTLAASISALGSSADAMSEALRTGDVMAKGAIGTTETLLIALDAAAREIDETLPEALARLDARITSSRKVVADAKPELLALVTAAESTHDAIEAIAQVIHGQRETLDKLSSGLADTLADSHEKADALGITVEETIGRAHRFAEEAAPRLVDALLRVRDTASAAAERARETLAGVIPEAAQALEHASADAMERATADTVRRHVDALADAANAATDAATRASERLAHQMITIADATAQVESRIEEGRAEREKAESDTFSRRVSLLIEALNSSAIDITRAFSAEVADSAWAAYLKGDRGVFTRRAVRLLDAGEAREIARLYDADAAFHDQVNRYIHDFEAMLRAILTQREGSPISVTLLSSDMGKLYVALAQAIERLRT